MEVEPRNLPEHNPENWQLFKDYCLRDVEVEYRIRKTLEIQYQEISSEYALWYLDQKINDKGILIDTEFVNNAIALYESHVDRLSNEMIQITGIKNPDSLGQLKDWFLKAEGIQIQSLTKQTIPELIAKAPSERAKKVLEMRQQLSKTSVKNIVQCKVQFAGMVQLKELFSFTVRIAREDGQEEIFRFITCPKTKWMTWTMLES